MLYLLTIVLYIVDTSLGYAAQHPDSSMVPYTKMMNPEFNLFWSSVKVVTALAVTFVILVVIVWILKRIFEFKKIPGISGGSIAVLDIRYIAPKKAVVLIKVVQRVLIVGFSDNSVTTLGELSPEEIERLELNKKTDSGVFRTILAGFTGNK